MLKSPHRVKFFFSQIGWMIVSLFALELVVRIFYGFPAARNINSPIWGRLTAGKSVVLYGFEGYGTTHYVADGEIATPDQGGENIVVLGDSYTEALQVNDDQKYPSIAEKMVRQDGYLVDIRNLGMGDRSIADYVFLAPSIIAEYNPSIVVIQLNRGDITDDAFNAAQSNYFTYKEDQPLSLVHQAHYYGNPWIARERDLLNYSSAFVNGYTRFLTIKTKNTVSIESTIMTSADPLDKTYALLEALKSAYNGRRLIILMIPYTPSIIGNEIVSGDDTTRRMVDIAKTIDGWFVIDPSREFDLSAKMNKIPRGFNNSIPGRGHINQVGHQIIGSMLANQIEDLLRTQK